MEQATTQQATTRKTTEPITFRLNAPDAAMVRNEAERRRTNMSALVRGALLEVGILKEIPDGQQQV